MLEMLFLHTVGRTTGLARRTGLFYVTDGPNLVIVASNDGEDVDPAWWRNLQARPDAEVEIGLEIGLEMRRVHARLATPDEAPGLYERFVAGKSSYAEYQERTTRPIPVVILEPR